MRYVAGSYEIYYRCFGDLMFLRTSIVITVVLFFNGPCYDVFLVDMRTPLWSSGQSSWLQIQKSRVRFPALPDFLRSGCGTGSTQLREGYQYANWIQSETLIPLPFLDSICKH
jgi:hypothetical protein